MQVKLSHMPVCMPLTKEAYITFSGVEQQGTLASDEVTRAPRASRRRARSASCNGC
jgi:hypothetical protein